MNAKLKFLNQNNSMASKVTEDSVRDYLQLMQNGAIHLTSMMRMVAFTYDTLPTVDGDPIQLAQLFQNLISKALKFKGAAPPGIDSATRRDGDFWIFSVKDNGIGVDL
jgi:chemotaxis family two-component system sensor kinase Cph1